MSLCSGGKNDVCHSKFSFALKSLLNYVVGATEAGGLESFVTSSTFHPLSAKAVNIWILLPPVSNDVHKAFCSWTSQTVPRLPSMV